MAMVITESSDEKESRVSLPDAVDLEAEGEACMPEVESKSGAESLPSDPETEPEIVGSWCCCVTALLKDKDRCAKVKELKQVLGALSLREQNQMLLVPRGLPC